MIMLIMIIMTMCSMREMHRMIDEDCYSVNESTRNFTTAWAVAYPRK